MNELLKFPIRKLTEKEYKYIIHQNKLFRLKHKKDYQYAMVKPYWYVFREYEGYERGNDLVVDIMHYDSHERHWISQRSSCCGYTHKRAVLYYVPVIIPFLPKSLEELERLAELPIETNDERYRKITL